MHPLYNEPVPADFSTERTELLPPKNTMPSDEWKTRMYFMSAPYRHAAYPACWDTKGHIRSVEPPFGRPAISNGHYEIGYGNVELHGDEGHDTGLPGPRLAPNKVGRSVRPVDFQGSVVGVAATINFAPVKKKAGRRSKRESVARSSRGKRLQVQSFIEDEVAEVGQGESKRKNWKSKRRKTRKSKMT